MDFGFGISDFRFRVAGCRRAGCCALPAVCHPFPVALFGVSCGAGRAGRGAVPLRLAVKVVVQTEEGQVSDDAKQDGAGVAERATPGMAGESGSIPVDDCESRNGGCRTQSAEGTDVAALSGNGSGSACSRPSAPLSAEQQARYEAFRGGLAAFESVVGPQLEAAGARSLEKKAMLDLARAVFGEFRRSMDVRKAARLGAERVRRGHDAAMVRLCLEASWAALGGAAADWAAQLDDAVLRLRRGRALARPGRNALLELQDEPTILEETRLSFAAKHLKAAISSLRPVERQCVIGRLARKMGFDELAQELEITRDDVAEILGRAKRLVQAHTTYFNSEWYWGAE